MIYLVIVLVNCFFGYYAIRKDVSLVAWNSNGKAYKINPKKGDYLLCFHLSTSICSSKLSKLSFAEEGHCYD